MKTLRATIVLEVTEQSVKDHGEPGETLESWEQMLKETSGLLTEDAPRGAKVSVNIEMLDLPDVLADREEDDSD